MKTKITLLALTLFAFCPSARGSDQKAPLNKLTASYYHFSSGKNGVDANLRHTFKTSTAWIGAYRESSGFDQVRLGYEYDYHHEWLTVVPSALAATHGFLGGSVYAEAGRRLFGIAGAGRTNLRPYWNLSFDPNDYAQAGLGYRDAAGNTISVYAIHDDRLKTGQTNTHVYVRRFFPHDWRVTLDIFREQGHGDGGIFVKDWAKSADVDWHRWFIRVAVDPHVNYTADRQLRIASGLRF
jgi:hypothetical protein